MASVYLLFSYCFLVQIAVCGAQSGSDLKNLITELFTTRGYKKNVRPNNDLSHPMDVTLDFFLSGVTGINELKQTMTTTGYLDISWRDEHLVWDPSSYGNIYSIYVSQSDIWKPDLTLRNGLTKLSELGGSFINAQIAHNGYVIWLPVEQFDSKCKIDIKYFPFDRQTCDIIFVAWSSSIVDVNVTKGNDGIILDNLEENGEWKIVSTSAYEDVEAAESTVMFRLILERSSSYYVMNIIVPVVLLSILNVFTFVLPADSGEKMGYSITVFLSFAVFLTIVSSELPKTSGSILGMYLMFQIGMGTFVVCLTSFELRLHHRKEPVPSKILHLFNCRKGCGKISDSSETEKGRSESDLAWSDIVSKIDFVLFWISFFVVIIVTFSVLAYLSTRH